MSTTLSPQCARALARALVLMSVDGLTCTLSAMTCCPMGAGVRAGVTV